ncbi:hypothetical protein D3C84_654620 [compost metagenome]
MLEHIACARALLAGNPAGAGQRLGVGLGQAGQGVAGRGDQYQLVFAPGAHIDIRMLYRPFDKTDIDREVAQRLDDALGVLDLELQAAMRLGGEKGSQQFRQQIGANGGAGTDAQVAGQLLLEQRFGFLGTFQGGLGVGVETSSVLVEHQALAMAIEQAGTELMLQVLQRHARRCLAQAQVLAGAGDAAKVGDGNEGGQLFESDAALHISFPDMTNKNI